MELPSGASPETRVSGSASWKSAGRRLEGAGDQPGSPGFLVAQPDDSIVRRLAPFDPLADTYDRDFTHTSLGRTLRARVWQRLAARFPAGSRVLELNCGTGEDARWLASRGVSVLGTDQSEAMLAVARRKCAGLPVTFAQLDLAHPRTCPPAHPLPFSGAFSNFGGLNCVADLRPLARALAGWLKPGAPLILVVMGPLCLWEIVWNLIHLKPRAAFRRLRRGGTMARIGGENVRVFYPWPGALARAFAPGFRVTRLSGLGVALPPSLMATTMETHGGLFRTLGNLESLLSRAWPFSLLGDHYVLELERGELGQTQPSHR